MLIDTNNIISISEVNQNFSRVANMVSEKGSIFVFKNNEPFLEIRKIDSKQDEASFADMGTVKSLHKKIVKENEVAYKELAK